jgi:DNA-binding transcriptional LysR family regulator
MLAIDRPVDPIQEEVDLAIRVRTKLDSGTALKMRLLGISRKILVSNRHLAGSIGYDIAQLANLPTLSTSDEPGETEWTLICGGGDTKKIRHDPRMRCSDFSAIRDAAAEGLGVALLPDHTCRDYLTEGKLVHVFPDWHSPDGFVHVVFTARKGVPVAMRAFIDHLVSAIPPGSLSFQEEDPHTTLPNGESRDDRVLVEAP